MDTPSRKGVLRRLIDTELNEFGRAGADHTNVAWNLSEPIEENRVSRGADDRAMLLAHTGCSWGSWGP